MRATVSYTVASGFPSLYQIEAQIQTALTAPLPGRHAHLLLAPRPRRGWEPDHVPSGAAVAAALLLLYPLDGTPHVLLTVRAGRLTQHGGQVSLPGGGVEGTETVQDAALREATEEVGIDTSGVRILGALSTLYIPVSDFALHPVLGLSEDAPRLRPAAAEVSRVLEVPLTDLENPRNLRLGMRWRRDRCYHVPYFAIQEERVWGATAMVLAELLGVLGSLPPDPW